MKNWQRCYKNFDAYKKVGAFESAPKPKAITVEEVTKEKRDADVLSGEKRDGVLW